MLDWSDFEVTPKPEPALMREPKRRPKGKLGVVVGDMWRTRSGELVEITRYAGGDLYSIEGRKLPHSTGRIYWADDGCFVHGVENGKHDLIERVEG